MRRSRTTEELAVAGTATALQDSDTIGGLGVDTGALVGFDVGRRYGGLAALQPSGGASRPYSVDLDSGRARDRGRIGGGESIKGLAIPIDGDRYDGGGDGWGGCPGSATPARGADRQGRSLSFRFRPGMARPAPAAPVPPILSGGARGRGRAATGAGMARGNGGRWAGRPARAAQRSEGPRWSSRSRISN